QGHSLLTTRVQAAICAPEAPPRDPVPVRLDERSAGVTAPKERPKATHLYIPVDEPAEAPVVPQRTKAVLASLSVQAAEPSDETDRAEIDRPVPIPPRREDAGRSEREPETGLVKTPKATPPLYRMTAEPADFRQAPEAAETAVAVEDRSSSPVGTNNTFRAQTALNALGFEVGRPTGQPNARTRLALLRYQRANDLPETGVADTASLAMLERAGAPDGEPTISASAPVETATDRMAIRRIQTALSEAGFDVGPIDGLMGPRTRTAIKRYQRENAFAVTGVADGAVMQALGTAGAQASEQSS
ncbi:MAG: peptidoglycan-binding domain-containing protein, partial [Pseudomonadota bacterium]